VVGEKGREREREGVSKTTNPRWKDWPTKILDPRFVLWHRRHFERVLPSLSSSTVPTEQKKKKKHNALER
jgi:hypothetical protein